MPMRTSYKRHKLLPSPKPGHVSRFSSKLLRYFRITANLHYSTAPQSNFVTQTKQLAQFRLLVRLISLSFTKPWPEVPKWKNEVFLAHNLLLLALSVLINAKRTSGAAKDNTLSVAC